MYNCIFSAHCTEDICDTACPILVETTNLLDRNNIKIKSDIFKISEENYTKAKTTLKKALATNLVVIEAKKTVVTADLITYCAICEHWQGSQLHCTVYNLRYAKYLDTLKSSWSSKQEAECIEYEKIFMNTAKVLVISGMDFVNFKDFESQTLLSLLQSREDGDKSTIIVIPSVNNLIGSGAFFERLKQELKEDIV